MFDIGPAEILVIAIVAIVVFGPDRLPDFARQIGRFVRTVRQMADNAKSDLKREMGDDYTTLRDELKGLDPREMVKSALDDEDEDNEEDDRAVAFRRLAPGEPAPFDVEAT